MEVLRSQMEDHDTILRLAAMESHWHPYRREEQLEGMVLPKLEVRAI